MAPLPHDQKHLERILARAIASAFESYGEAWLDDTSGDRLAGVAAQAVSRQLIEAGVNIREAGGRPLTTLEHRKAAERLLSEASFAILPGGRPVGRNGAGVSVKQLRLLVARAQVHALLAALPEEER